MIYRISNNDLATKHPSKHYSVLWQRALKQWRHYRLFYVSNLLWCSVLLNNSSKFFWKCKKPSHTFTFYLSLSPTVKSTGHPFWSKTVSLFCLFLALLQLMLCPSGVVVDLLQGNRVVKEVNFQGPCSSNQNSIIDFTSRGTRGSQGPWQFYLWKKLKGSDSRRTVERGGCEDVDGWDPYHGTLSPNLPPPGRGQSIKEKLRFLTIL